MGDNMRPIIGVVARFIEADGFVRTNVSEDIRRKIIEFGGIPIMIMPTQNINYLEVRYDDQEELSFEEKEMLIKQINLCDGIVLPGGNKINKFDRFIAEYLINNDIPTLGICLGMQILSNYNKEKLWNEKNDSSIIHKTTAKNAHYVSVEENSKLFTIVKSSRFMVNSRHNYHVLSNLYFNSVAFSDDGYIEAIEMKDKKFIIGVQWHPETLEDEESKSLFTYFINICK